MKIGITGALGFIGSALAARLRADGNVVVGVDLLATDHRDDGIVPGDVSEPGAWGDALQGCDLVIHTAAIVANARPLDDMWRVNVLGTKRVLDAAVAGGARRFIHLSSVRAFSDIDFPDQVDETWPVRTDGRFYVDTKVASEQVVLQAHAAGDIAVTIIRPADVYGPGSGPWTVWPVMGMPINSFVLPSDGGVFSPVYIDNLVDGIVLASGDAGIGQVFIIGDGIGVPNEEFFGHYADMLGIELPIVPADDAADMLERAGVGADTVFYFRRTGSYSIEKARSVLGYEPAVDLAEGMRRTEIWLRETGLLPASESD